MTDFQRPDGRAPNELRTIAFTPDFAPNAPGSLLCAFGQTRVICAATLEKKIPPWMRQQGISGGWMSAEYSMLPYSTHDRKQRDINRGKLDGRTVEIQRLIGRSLRAVLDLQKLPGHTLWVDCDVLQADGGTRTAAITGAYLAARIAIEKALLEGKISENPFRDSLAAISAGIYQGKPVLDLNYLEDKEASVDANIVMTGNGSFVEVQSSGEEATFSPEELQSLLSLAGEGIAFLKSAQETFLKEHLPHPDPDALLSKASPLD
ncbi:MAG: ribonuclease PH [Opitutales bacterium]|nr:ribonuclease PH [Opitutales bacterium]MCH8540566.1 ribonuclease PH [Opitutales bacterium]